MMAQTQQAAPQHIFEGKEHQLDEHDSGDEEQQQSLLEEDERVEQPHQSQFYGEEDDAGGLLDLD